MERRVARYLVIAGSLMLFASAGIHSFAAYPSVSAAIDASNLVPIMKTALRTLFILAGWHWFVMGLLALLAVLRAWPSRKPIAIFLGVALVGETLLTLAMIGPFIGDEMLGAAAVLVLAGGVLLGERRLSA
jgi:hypothetical protein